ncbi:FecR family protein [Novosphingobium pentaromativorans]|uniref:FecR-like transmembrane sensor n=1 Tax=Novosphingobium pentaromativorans US6-1 TaxID=1088721 RepID=G6EFY1_9SPHN|nr:FecR domain-containing protein [Novosphingobium pentaromativorans]AIT82320.1 iron dicitrate transport regulator FecR [Novosphingobium pentaromativorans US6-1]EHJ59670.1 FecR-like transmembrane sensor [Novosphingobium pentaromativorans US6-1]
MVIRIGAFRSYEERLEEIQAQAAWWIEREHLGPMREAERIELREWLARSPAHELEYMLADNLYADDDLVAAMQDVPRITAQRTFWSALDAVGNSVAAAARTLAQVAGPRLVAATLALALMVAAVSYLAPFGRDPMTGEDPRIAAGMTLKTHTGERLVAQLPDGTRVEMGGGSEAQVRFSDSERRFALTRGDALFDVAHDPARPFLIATDRASIRVVGTRFLIREMAKDTRVDVYQGVVEVRAPKAEAATMRVRRGSRVTIGQEVTIGRFEAGAEEDWRGGWVDEAAISLADLADLIERRTATPIAVDPALAAMQVSGRFRITQPDRLLEKLAPLYGFKARREGEGWRISK